MSFIAKRKQQLGISSLGDLIRAGKIRTEKDSNLFIHGPNDFDCLVDKWARKEVMGLIGPSGGGKTQLTLGWFRDILLNSNDPNSVCVFVSLEMTTDKIAQRWIKMNQDTPELADRLYIISNYDEKGKAKMLTTETILKEAEQIQNALEVDIISMGVDHLHIIEFHQGQGADYNKVCARVKELAVELNTFIVLLSQTTKGKSGAYSDKPLDADASYNCSQFKWVSSYVITIHLPLGALAGSCDLNVLAWAYQKIREKDLKDGTQVGVFNLLKYNMDNGRLTKLDRDDMFRFSNYYKQVEDIRRETEEDEGYAIYNTKINGKALSDREAMLYDKPKRYED